MRRIGLAWAVFGRIRQRAIECVMLAIIRRRTGDVDVTERIARLKQQWAGHVAGNNHEWTKTLMQWIPRNSKRSFGRPQTRGRDDIQRGKTGCIMHTRERRGLCGDVDWIWRGGSFSGMLPCFFTFYWELSYWIGTLFQTFIASFSLPCQYSIFYHTSFNRQTLYKFFI